MVDATILTKFAAPNNTGVIRAFQNTLLNKANIDAQEQAVAERRANAPLRNQLLEAQVGQAQQQELQQREESRARSVVTAAAELAPTIRRGDVNAVRTQLLQRKTKLIEQGLPTNDTDEAIALLSEPDGLAQLQSATQQAITLGQQLGVLDTPAGSGGLASAKTEFLGGGVTMQALPDRTTQVTDESGNVVEGQARLDAIARAEESGVTQKQRLADIEVDTARKKARATQRADRVSSLKKEMSERNRNAARESIRLNQALKLAGTADQGLTGSVKLQLAKLFPDIDVTDEAALDQSLTALALDQLQNFKGPTTDFEFGVTQSITGQLGDARTANIAKLKSLDRANWFNKREFDQFSQHVKSGGDPDAFAFNFGEPMKTKKGVFTLQQVQDTAVANNLSIDETLARLNK